MEELSIRSVKAQRNLVEWTGRVADCRNSGVSVRRWCAEHEINPKTYYNWQRKVFAAMIAQQQAEGAERRRRFAELPVPQEESAPEKQAKLAACIRIGNTLLEVYNGASAEIISALCTVLQDAK